jgi:hypothetical protein
MSDPPDQRQATPEHSLSWAKKYFYEEELGILQYVRWFVIVAGAATFLHFFTDLVEPRVWLIVSGSLRGLEILLFMCDVVVLFAALIVHTILQLRRTFLLLHLDIFAVFSRSRERKQ